MSLKGVLFDFGNTLAYVDEEDDRRYSDLEGAREVGLKTILVRQGEHTTHNAKDPNFKPEFQCNKISEILNFL